MLYLGLSGGIGSGKSTVSARLVQLGAIVIDADALAREVVEPGSGGLAEIATRFGDEVLLPDGSLNRPALGAIVFADISARRDLEAITHPRIRELTAQRRAQAPRDAIVVHDMPLLVEGDLAPDYHLTLIVDAAQEVRIERVMRDRGMTEDAALARVSAQATDAQRYAVADVLLDNNGTRDQLLEQVETLWRERLSPYNENLLAARPVLREAAVRIVDADPAWSARAARAIARLRHQVRDAGLQDRIVGIDHIGSTSVPGLAAKDVIDLQLCVHDLDLATTRLFANALLAAGFTGGHPRQDTAHAWAPDPGAWRKWLFFGCDPVGIQHLHVRGAVSPGADVALLFRDWLRAHPAERDAYQREKRRAAAIANSSAGPTGTADGPAPQHYGSDYTQEKEPWIAAALLRARAWRDANTGPVRK